MSSGGPLPSKPTRLNTGVFNRVVFFCRTPASGTVLKAVRSRASVRSGIVAAVLSLLGSVAMDLEATCRMPRILGLQHKCDYSLFQLILPKATHLCAELWGRHPGRPMLDPPACVAERLGRRGLANPGGSRGAARLTAVNLTPFRFLPFLRRENAPE